MGTQRNYRCSKSYIRTRIYESLYWKESCFDLTAETLIDRAVVLTSFQKPTEFLCLTLKLLHLQPVFKSSWSILLKTCWRTIIK
ncbi:hypothetical protein C2G38_1564830 [Gigaspora rosea]|uniref:Pre-mRNA-splicing factor 38 n=1 Tax=Gigaspora rosea TaxID=44941 RepID=A0A397W3R8_9GLOM|nr:hypothetical protein C2G38_1564830 [Gigaspora rosea]